jgi:hypothetical protein
MITLKERPGQRQVLLDRASAQRRLKTLMMQVEHLNAARDHEQLIAIKAAIGQCMSTIEAADAALHAPPPADFETPSTIAGIQARHARMRHLLTMLDDLPKSCTESAKVLRRALMRELRGPSIGRTR